MGLVMERGGPYSRELHKARGGERGCWYYLGYFFLFISIIQFLIILGLVLFMVYGNAHSSTESNLEASERRTDELYGQVLGLTASQSNLTKQLNITIRNRESFWQQLMSTRRELDRINASFRQCQTDRAIYINNERYMAAIILSEKQCMENLKENNKSCNALLLMLGQKTRMLEVELEKEKAVCTKDKETLVLGKRVVEEQLAECGKVQGRLQQEKRIAEEHLQKVQTLCFRWDKEKFETDLRNIWRDSTIARTLDSLAYAPYLGGEVASLRRTCERMPELMSTKVEELARSLRVDIERVTRENADLQRQKQEAERALQASQEAKEKEVKEAQAREGKLQSECARQTQLALEEKAALRKEKDNLAKELEEKKKEVEQLKIHLAVSNSARDTCLKARTHAMPFSLSRPAGSPPNPPAIDQASLEEFKKKILESQRSPASNVAVPPSFLTPASLGSENRKTSAAVLP